MRIGGWALLVAGLCGAGGCQGVCLDDGFAGNQSNEACLALSATMSATEGPTSTSASATESATESVTQGSMSVSMSATESASVTESASATGTATSTPGGAWCLDMDMDGFGDPMNCIPQQPGDPPPPGYVPDDTDCADGDPNTFPGAAEKEDPQACMQDEDGDGWGDTMPDDPDAQPGTDCDDGDPDTFPGAAPNDDASACMTDKDQDDWGDDTPSDPDAQPGTDCDDDDAATFPGAAEDESMTACMRDEDEDGWGDSSVDPGVEVGADCYDTNPDLNPGDRVFYSALDGGDFGSIDVMTGQVNVFASVDIAPLMGNWSLITCSTSPTDGMTYCSQSAKSLLVRLDYCSGATPTELAVHDRSICGLAFDPSGILYGIDSGADELVVFDPATGMVTDSKPLTLDGNDLALQACGMALDCVTSRLLVTDGQQSRVLSVDPATGEATVIADVDLGSWSSVGLEYDSVSKQVYSCNGANLYQIALDGSDQYMQQPMLSQSLNDLQYGPSCN